MKLYLTFCLSLVFNLLFCQDSTYYLQFLAADSIVQNNKFQEGFEKIRLLENVTPETDTIYDHVLWYYVGLASELESYYRFNEKFDSSLYYANEALIGIEKGIPKFDLEFAQRKYFMIKNIIVANSGLSNSKEFNKFKSILYDGYTKGILPEGIDGYFNFDFFRWEDKNIWGYEWYPELGDPETEGSFSKIVYYVYSTNEYGEDQEQLYRLHVLKVHKSSETMPDYVLTKRLETAKNEVSGTLWSFTYDKMINYSKLRKDIQEVLKGNYQPDTKTTTTRNNDGKVETTIEMNLEKEKN